MKRVATGLLLAVIATQLFGCGSESLTSYTIGGNVSGLNGTVTLSNNANDTKVLSVNGAFTFPTALASGAYSVTVSTQPAGQTCSVTNGSGVITGAPVTNVLISCVGKPYSVGGTVSGLLTGSSVTLVNNDIDVKTPNTNGTFVFDNTVLSGSTYAVKVSNQTAGNPCSVSNGSGVVSAANVTNVSITCGTTVTYVANKSSNTISRFVVTATGGLTSADTTATLAQPVSIKVDPSGKYAYVIYQAGGTNTTPSQNKISQFTIDAGGALTPMTVPDVTLPCVSKNPCPSVYSFAIDASGKYLYAVDYLYNTVWQYGIGSNGTLTALSPASVSTGAGPYSVTIDPSGKYAYVTNWGVDGAPGNTISQYTICPSAATSCTPGTLQSLGTVSTGTTGSGPYFMVIDKSSKYAYVTNGNTNTISKFDIGVDGSLTFTAGTSNPIDSGGNLPFHLTMDSTGKYLYVVNTTSGAIGRFSIGSTGALTSLGSSTVAPGVIDIAVEPTGQFLYATSNTSNSVLQFSLNSSTGALSAIAPSSVPTGIYPIGITIH